MTNNRIIELLKTERECVRRNSHNECNRDCGRCSLVQEDNELEEFYTTLISVFENLPEDIMSIDGDANGTGKTNSYNSGAV